MLLNPIVPLPMFGSTRAMWDITLFELESVTPLPEGNITYQISECNHNRYMSCKANYSLVWSMSSWSTRASLAFCQELDSCYFLAQKAPDRLTVKL